MAEEIKNITEEFKNTSRKTRQSNVEAIKQNYADLTASVSVDINDSLKLYLYEISKYPLLTPQQEYAYGERKANGDKEARDMLINSNLRFVVSLAKKAVTAGVDIMDLIQDGNVGLARAVDKWDYKSGNRLTTFAAYDINLAMSRGTLATSKATQLPAYMQERVNLLNRLSREFYDKYGYEPSNEELLDEYNSYKSEDKAIDLEDIIEYRDIVNRKYTSLDAYIGDDEKSSYGDIISDPTSSEIKDEVDKEEMNEILVEALKLLSDRDKKIMLYYFGLFGYPKYNCEQIARELGVSAKVVRTAKDKALEKMKPFLEQYAEILL